MDFYALNRIEFVGLFTYHFQNLWHTYQSTMRWTPMDVYTDDAPEFFDVNLGYRDRIEWILNGIKVCDHEEDYVWLGDFRKRLSNSDTHTLTGLVPKVMRYCLEKNLIFPESQFYGYYPVSFWWRLDEYRTYLNWEKGRTSDGA